MGSSWRDGLILRDPLREPIVAGVKPEPNRCCPQCGSAFTCDYEAGRSPCWCSRDFPAQLPLTGAARGCLCPRCLAEALRQVAPPREPA